MGKLTEGLSRPAAASSIDLRAWCDEQNRKPISAKLGRWYYVTERDGEDLIDTLSGTDADCLRQMLNGRLGDFAGWSTARMNGYRRWLNAVAERGLLRQREAA